MTDLRKAAEMALEYLEYLNELDIVGLDHEIQSEALRQALAQPANKSDCGHTEYKPFCQMCMATKQKHEGRITALEIRVAKLEKPMTDHEKQLMAGQRSLLRITPPSKPINFLVNGTRYKVTGLHDSGAIMGLPENLNGQWVALVDATDDKHLQYTAPPSKPWVSLTDEEADILIMLHAPPIHPDFNDDDDFIELVNAIEAKLKEKNT